MDIIVTKMTLLDFNEISNNLTYEFDNFWTPNILKEELQNNFSTYICAKLNNKIIGFAGIKDTVDQMEITNIVVKKDFRNKGIGNTLLKELINLSKKSKKKQIILEVNVTNIPAIKLYEKNGFKKIGLRKKYYNNTYDANIMALQIS